MRKKIFLVLISLLLTFSLTACQKEKPLNYDRGTDYQYDFIDFIDIKQYGSDGSGFIEITPKDVKLGDVINGKAIPEKDIISIMKLIDEIGFYVGPNEEISSRLNITNNHFLKNGDTIAFYFDLENFTTEVTDITMNLEPYYHVVDGFPAPVVYDLFDNHSVLFYGIENLNDVYALKVNKGDIPEEVFNSLVYSAKIQSGEKVEVNKTIIDAKVDVDETVLKGGSNPAFNKETFFGRRAMTVVTEKEKILTKVLPQLNIDSIDQDKMKNAINAYLENQTITINDSVYSSPNIMTLQVKEDLVKNSRAASDYVTTFRVYGSQGTLCLTMPLRIVNIDDTYVIPAATGTMQAVSNDACGSVINGNVMVVNYNTPIIEPTPYNENGENSETPSENSEENNQGESSQNEDNQESPTDATNVG